MKKVEGTTLSDLKTNDIAIAIKSVDWQKDRCVDQRKRTKRLAIGPHK
jgi:hypothetical protein